MQNCFFVGEKSPEFCVINWDVVPKCSSGLVQGSGQSPELLVLVFPFLLVLGKCSWDWVQGSGQSPELLVLVFHFLLVLRKRSLKWARALVQVQGRAQSSRFLFSPSCLSLGKGGSCVVLCFPSWVHTRNPLGSLELGQSCAVEFLQSGCDFSLFQGLKISGVLKSLRTSPSDSG